MASGKRRTWGHAAPKPTLDEMLITRQETNRVRAQFLKTDLQAGLTFVKVAHQTGDDSQKRRSLQAARRVYDTVTSLALKVHLTADDSQELERGLAHLKAELQALGETF